MELVLLIGYIGAMVALLILQSKFKKSLQSFEKRIADLEQAIGGYYKGERSEY